MCLTKPLKFQTGWPPNLFPRRDFGRPREYSRRFQVLDFADNKTSKHTETEKQMKDEILHDHHHDNIERRGFLKCMAWVGTGVLYSASGGILRSETMDKPGADSMKPA